MPLYHLAFAFIFFFVLGVFLASVGFSLSIIIVFSFLLLILFFIFSIAGFRILNFHFSWFFILGILSLVIILGSIYFDFYQRLVFKEVKLVFNQKINFSGVVVSYPERGEKFQRFKVLLDQPYSGIVLVKMPLYPEFFYGDKIKFFGKIKKAPAYGYFKKEKISGVVYYPQAKLISKNKASKIKYNLFLLKKKIVGIFQKILPYQESAFLSGITLGERAEFLKEFEDQMAKSGTTHLVALSGYNITILGYAIGFFIGRYVSQRYVFYLTALAIFGFVIMTGAEASVVRAGIMGFIALLATHTSNIYSVRNAIAVAGFLMILINPYVLYFDLGFQLSFLALLGLVYLNPALKKMLKAKEEPGFLNWRENFFSTLSAQLMVIPLLLLTFNYFSLTSFLANILILEVVPVAMFFGFLSAFLGFFSLSLAQIFGWLLWFLLEYKIIVIKIFSEIALPISFGIFSIIIYYLILIFIYWRYYASFYRH